MPPKSPVTGSNNVALEREILSSFVVEEYKKGLGIDVKPFFQSIGKISVYKCLDTGYRFYYPFNTAGNDKFYQELEKFPWYYMDDKWEHFVATDYIQKNNRVLEIGCARGSFLKTLKNKGIFIEGLEMNSQAVSACKDNGLSVQSDSIDEFSEKNKNKYDIVCSFQVMEHVAEVRNFLQSSLSVLKPQGLLLISVPNNDSLIFKSGDISLNMPPHHMGMWDINSLIKLQKYFNIKVESVHIEPLQKYHDGYAMKIAYKNISKKLNQKLGIFSKFVIPIARRFTCTGVSAVTKFMIGHSILIVFKKNDDK